MSRIARWTDDDCDDGVVVGIRNTRYDIYVFDTNLRSLNKKNTQLLYNFDDNELVSLCLSLSISRHRPQAREVFKNDLNSE